jgi:hypothetical protein
MYSKALLVLFDAMVIKGIHLCHVSIKNKDRK